MTFRKLILLLLFTLIIGAAAWMMILSEREALSARVDAATGSSLLPGLNISTVREIVLRSRRGQTTLILDPDGIWRIHERNSYPARTDLVNNLLFRLTNAKVAESMTVPKKRLDRLGLALPPLNVESNTETIPVQESDFPLSIEMFGGTGIHSAPVLVCGMNVYPKDVETNPLAKISGRHYWVGTDPYTVCLVSETLDGLTSAPSAWLDRTFVVPGEIASLSLAPPPGSPMIGWTLKRISAAEPFQITGESFADSGIFDAESADTATFFLNAISFEDVKPLAEFDPAEQTLLSVATFNGRVYRFTLSNQDDREIWATVQIKPLNDSVIVQPAENAAYKRWAYCIPRHSFARILKSRPDWFIAPDSPSLR